VENSPISERPEQIESGIELNGITFLKLVDSMNYLPRFAVY